MCEGALCCNNTLELSKLTLWYDSRFQVVLKQTTVCFAVDSDSSGCAVYWDWAYQKRVIINFLANGGVWNFLCFGSEECHHSLALSLAESNVPVMSSVTICHKKPRLALSLSGSNVPSIRFQWLYVTESNLLQLQNIINFTNILSAFFQFGGELFW